MKHFFTKKTIFTLLVLISSSIYANSTFCTLDKNEEVHITELIFYQNPICIEYDKINELHFPEWYPAYCANGYFDFFSDYPTDAVKYFHSKSNVSIAQLKDHQTRINNLNLTKEEKYPNPYSYIFGEVKIKHIGTTENLVLVLGYVDTLSTKRNDINFNDNENPFSNFGNTTSPYIYEDSILKRANINFIFYELLGKDNKRWTGITYNHFMRLIESTPTYTRSRIVDGERIFETIRNTPDGPVVVGEDDKAWFLRYWWALLLGVVIVGYFISRRK